MAENFKVQVDKLTFQNVFDAKMLEDTAEAALSRVKQMHQDLAKDGKDPDGASFDPLSPGYRKRKVADGQEGIRNLSFTGRMWIGANVSRVKNGAEFGFAAADVGKARGNERINSFHYLSSSDQEVIEDLFSKKLDEGLKDLVKIKRSK